MANVFSLAFFVYYYIIAKFVGKMKNMESIRTFIVSIITGLAAYFSPIEGEFQVLFILFSVNFIAGLLAGILVDNDKFRFKKAFRCISELTCLMLFISAMYSIGERKNDIAGILQLVSFVTYVVVWFYTQNILRNLKSLFKTGTMHMVCAFLYYIVSVEFVKRIPYLQEYFDIENNQKNK